MSLYPGPLQQCEALRPGEGLGAMLTKEKAFLSLPSAVENPVPARDGDGSFADTLSARAFLRARGPSPEEREALP